MRKYSKAGLLIVTLVIPALIFTFLRLFATNHYNIPFYFPVTDSRGHVKVSKGDTLFYAVQKLNVRGLYGAEFARRPFLGKLSVVHFQPRPCDDSCGIFKNNLERIYGLKETIKTVNLVTIMDSLTGTVEQKARREGRAGVSVAVVGSRDLNILLEKVLKFGTPVPSAKIIPIEAKLILIDENEHIRGYYNGYDPEEINRLMAEIKILDFEKGEDSRN